MGASSIKETVKKLAKPILGRARPGNVAMFHLGRCGSTVVTKMLHQHPRVHWASELFAPLFSEDRTDDLERVEGVTSADDAVAYLKRDMGAALHRYYGVEFKPYHIQAFGFTLETFVAQLNALGFTHYIFLDRENRLRKVVSTLVARSNKGKYHLSQGEKAALTRVHVGVADLRVDLENKSLVAYLDEYDQEVCAIRSILEGENRLELSYERDIQADPHVAYQRTCEFLGIEPQEVAAGFARTNPFSLSDIIENYDEVCEALAGTPHQWMLKD